MEQISQMLGILIICLSAALTLGDQSKPSNFGYPGQSQLCWGAKWVKLNRKAVCFAGRGNVYGSFIADMNLLIHKVKFVYRSGKIFCGTSASGYFGCDDAPSVFNQFSVFLTDSEDIPIVPAPPVYYSNNGWYRAHGHKTSATTLTLSTGSSSYGIKAGDQLRVWYGEDLVNLSEGDNSGTTCTDVYGLV